ncbi:hypothetical protein JHK84_043638 [Glycine max]|nr:hypothetical protein JHK86_043450 [Glycine max]KAG5117525.1 hypothetical protein JHK84_043638 [Glycine max]
MTWVKCNTYESAKGNPIIVGSGALLKNAIDWASRPPNVWAGKAAAIVRAGGDFGGGRSHYHLRQIGLYIDLHFDC